MSSSTFGGAPTFMTPTLSSEGTLTIFIRVYIDIFLDKLSGRSFAHPLMKAGEKHLSLREAEKRSCTNKGQASGGFNTVIKPPKIGSTYHRRPPGAFKGRNTHKRSESNRNPPSKLALPKKARHLPPALVKEAFEKSFTKS
ncbi:hypothetical protein BD01_1035 [Thermococcus nautili]|uniref:Uncharacterized protein n=1 Tax=Thermococcus nautili TaxID=195522 RepID=W8NU27_9EURY|nr:hypothetical protein BD01_1035 [Thermococcus nautili]